MTTVQSRPGADSYLGIRAQLLKTRWEKRLGQPLKAQTDRLMAGPNGDNYRADIVLQDAETGLPVVAFEVLRPGAEARHVEDNLRRILGTRRFIALLGGELQHVVLLVTPGDEAAGERLRQAVGTQEVELEVM